MENLTLLCAFQEIAKSLEEAAAAGSLEPVGPADASENPLGFALHVSVVAHNCLRR